MSEDKNEKNKSPCSDSVTGNDHASLNWLLVDGNGFGFAKIVGNTVKNYYPKGLRFHI